MPHNVSPAPQHAGHCSSPQCSDIDCIDARRDCEACAMEALPLPVEDSPVEDPSVPSGTSATATPPDTPPRVPVPRRTRCRCCRRLEYRRNMEVLTAPFHSATTDDNGEYKIYPVGRGKVCSHHRMDGDIVLCSIDGGCGEFFHSHRVMYATLPNGRSGAVCAGCRDRLGLRPCRQCSQLTANPTQIGGRDVCASCARIYCECADCSRIIRINSGYENTDGASICPYCTSNYWRCAGCDGYHRAGEGEERVQLAGVSYCESCAPDLDGPNFDWRPLLDNRSIDADTGERIIGATNVLTGSPRLFGIELEFSRTSSMASARLADKTGWGACPDGTSGVCQEFKSPPMSGDDGIASVDEFCELAQRYQFAVSRACGFHAHFAMADERELSLARIACAYQSFLPLWRAFVPPSRRANHFCNGDRSNGSAEEIARGHRKPYKERMDRRYMAINWQSMHRHRTMEVRLHTGTMVAEKVNNWIRAHLSFIEFARRTPVADLLAFSGATGPELFSHVRSKVWEGEIAEFYRERARKFGVMLDVPAVHTVALPPQSPDDPGWAWTEEDMQDMLRYNGYRDEPQIRARYGTHTHLRDLYLAGALRRRPSASVRRQLVDGISQDTRWAREIGAAAIIPGYIEDGGESDV